MPAIPQPAPGISYVGLMARGQSSPMSSPISTFSSYGSNCSATEARWRHCIAVSRLWDKAPVCWN